MLVKHASVRTVPPAAGGAGIPVRPSRRYTRPTEMSDGRESEMRRVAGGYLRDKRTGLLLLLAAGGGVVVGLWFGYVLHQMMGVWLDGVSASIAMGSAILVVIAAFWLAFRSIERGRLQRLEKGMAAEVRTGHAIEDAITAPHCATAHTVTDIARVGDIDHLVATPVRLWVIETKYQRVPRDRFPEVLRRLAHNAAAVREWAPPRTPVCACLVLAYESKIHRKNYDHGKERIVAHTTETFVRALKTEAARPRTLDTRVAAEVWKLARIAG